MGINGRSFCINCKLSNKIGKPMRVIYVGVFFLEMEAWFSIAQVVVLSAVVSWMMQIGFLLVWFDHLTYAAWLLDQPSGGIWGLGTSLDISCTKSLVWFLWSCGPAHVQKGGPWTSSFKIMYGARDDCEMWTMHHVNSNQREFNKCWGS